MREDISDILKAWEYNKSNNVRVIKGKDGKEKIQIRLPLGIEQFEMDGRPDNRRPYGKESLLEYYKAKLDNYRKKKGSDEGFCLTSEDCSRLYDEGLLYYYRYVLFFQLRDYERMARDTERNLEYFDFVKKYAMDEQDKLAVEQYRPYLIRMNKLAKGLRYLEQKKYEQALEEIEEGIRLIESLPNMDNETFIYERKRSLGILRGMVKEIMKEKPLSQKDRLKRKLAQAIAAENYEKAAQLRDQLRELEKREREDGNKIA